MSKISESVHRWLRHIKREKEPPTVEELERRVKELELLLNQRTLEHEEHLNQVRLERDGKAFELDQLTQWMNTIANSMDVDVPSIKEQTRWPVGFFDFGKATQGGVRFFNCSIVDRHDGDWLFTRRSVAWPIADIGMNDIVAFKLHANKMPDYGVVVQLPRRYQDQHFEDPRVQKVNGKIVLSCCTFQVKKDRTWTGAHQAFAELDPTWRAPRIRDPIYGENKGSIYMHGGKSEKNWTWFGLNGKIYLIYMTLPHEVVEFGEFVDRHVRVFKTEDTNPMWQHGHPRGGSPAIQVGDEFFCFFHSSTPWLGRKRRYHMGAYAFEAKPPFRITRMTSLPLLSGSKADPWSEGLPLVVFPGGALFRNNVWTVVFGVNDYVSAWIDIPHEELLQTMRDVGPRMQNRLATMPVMEPALTQPIQPPIQPSIQPTPDQPDHPDHPANEIPVQNVPA